jgi:hypothetical protein
MKGLKVLPLLFIATTAGIVGTWALMTFVFNNSSLTTTTFQLNLVDPLNPSVPMKLSSFDCTVYGLKPAHAPGDASSWETITGMADLSEIDQEKVAHALLDHDALYVLYNGTMADDADTYNDGLHTRTYGIREAPLVNGVNNLECYVTPTSGASFIITNDATGAIITTSNITTSINFTVTEYLNNRSFDAYDQCYVSYVDHLGNVIAPNIWITFGSKTGATLSITTSDLVTSGMTVAREATNQLMFSQAILGQGVVAHSFSWGATARTANDMTIKLPSSTGIVEKFGTAAI